MAGTHKFSFDRIIGPTDTQQNVFNEIAKPVVDGIINVMLICNRSALRLQWYHILLWINRQWQDVYYGSKDYVFMD